ncbi:hypothetical protein L208DRAFT_1077362, partial [Tricholoma matsutake]
LISLFRKEKGASFVPASMHKALYWSCKDPYLEWPHHKLDWEIIQPKNHKEKKHVESGKCGVSPTPLTPEKGVKKAKMPEHTSSVVPQSWKPEGTQWLNNSCAYDTIVTLMFNMWKDD